MLSRSTQIKIKYTLDQVLGLVLMVLLWPLFVFIALAIKLDDMGPVFFKQPRLGMDGATFPIWKFRTMVVNADRLLKEDGTVGDVNRVTRVGHILRATSLDELPQLINILKGEMSFIGPRPTPVEHIQRYNVEQQRRLLMKPGVTGWAQINGRNLLKWSKRLEHDVWYIGNYSLWLDCKILLRTVKVVVLREGMVLDRNSEQVDDLPKPSEVVKQEQIIHGGAQRT